ncbi:Trypsin domain containing protein [Asbolus verrucosus]|uniref:Trypsin domain containing protein n=1 Tax=Asbolus verrucosus TaxID=1661398 RepID=A0A482VKR8_ASBVE|nr:Trypsin domain containing protein [Asbolus verrucosus]
MYQVRIRNGFIKVKSKTSTVQRIRKQISCKMLPKEEQQYSYEIQNNIQRLCRRNLISEQFILIAAHCIYPQQFAIVKWIRLSDLDIESTTDDAKPQDFKISEIFVQTLVSLPRCSSI